MMSRINGSHGLFLLLIVVLWTACANPPGDRAPGASPPPSSAAPAPKSEFLVCQDPRPEACTREYLPVCAHTMSGTLETRPNACVGCADKTILGHRPGACR